MAVILVNWNGWRDSVECVDSLLGMRGVDFDIYLVDNDSSDGSVEHLLGWCQTPVPPPPASRLPGVAFATLVGATQIPCVLLDATETPCPPELPGTRVHIVRAGANRGFAGGNNVGLRVAGLQRYSHFWLLNTDTVVHEQALHELLARAQADPTLGMVGSSLLYFDRPDLVQAMGGAQVDPRRMMTVHIGIRAPAKTIPADPSDVESRMGYVIGASMLVTASFVRDIGPMQEDYFLYFEELDWAQRALGRYRLGYAPGSRVYHRVGASSAKQVSVLAETLLTENRIRVLGRYFRPHRWTALSYLFWVGVRHVLRGRFLHARIQFTALLKAPRLLKA